MDFLRFRSGRTPANTSKRFPTKEPEKSQAQIRPQPQHQQSSAPRPRRKAKSSVQFEFPPTQNGNQTTIPSQSKGPERDAPPRTQSQGQTDRLPEKDRPSQSQDSAQKPVEVTKASSDRAMPDTRPSGSDSGDADYDLRPPQSKPKPASIDTLSELLFSEGYLSTITTDPPLLARFTKFLNKYKPDISHFVIRYLETQKIIKAIDYANAVASTLQSSNPEMKDNSSPAAELSASFLEASRDAFNTLLTIALPAWVTYSLVKTSTSCLTAEITNQSTPLTRDLVGGLSEVFCITDPTQEDNPIVYSSEEFYRLTGYDKNSVIGHNCRFLQGPKTKPESVQRLRMAIKSGEEISETLLNYRRDGRPFVNVLMLAPLHDDKGKVKYYLGAQVDASRLVEGGRGIDGYERFLVKREMESERGRNVETDPKRKALAKLRDLSLTFDLEESAVVQSNSRSSSMTRGDDGSVASTNRPSRARRVLQDEDERSGSDDNDDGDDDKDNPAWKLSQDKLSGGLPGVYQKYVLIRPYPSLRIIFVSQAVRKMGQLQQRPFLAHVAAPSTTLSGLKDSFQSGAPVTAKIAIMAQAGKSRDGTATGRWSRRRKEDNGGEDPAKLGKTCWISATPLLDSDNKAGVWMVVIVDKTIVASNTGRRMDAGLFPKSEAKDREQESALIRDMSGLDLPIKPKPVGLFDLGSPTAQSPLLAGTGEEYGQLPNHTATEAAEEMSADAAIDDEVAETAREPQEKSQRSESLLQEGGRDEHYVEANNPPITESPNGSPVLDSVEHLCQDGHQDPEQDGPVTPTRENHDLAIDTTPIQSGAPARESHSARQVGLRAMDYLASHSPVHKRQVNGVEGDTNVGEPDWNLASPYSVD